MPYVIYRDGNYEWHKIKTGSPRPCKHRGPQGSRHDINSPFFIVSAKANKSMKLLDVKQLSELMGVSPGHIRNLMSNKKITYYKIPGVGIRFLATDVLAWIDQARVEAKDWDCLY